jgi:hypothetical protein
MKRTLTLGDRTRIKAVIGPLEWDGRELSPQMG